ncbi:MAG: DUF2510 domain-containing protein [Gordonia sp. (in: high G+C Gram-positive bacteria)]|uniref:DUF2510 domain-containing protein n=1 Tax=Gordonia sp. (in: high G+C Gram-positive bacteria) TaxID=84139 RepID=UPI0039E43556
MLGAPPISGAIVHIDLYSVYALDSGQSSAELAQRLSEQLGQVAPHDGLTRARIQTALAILSDPGRRSAYDVLVADPSIPITEQTLAAMSGVPQPGAAPVPSAPVTAAPLRSDLAAACGQLKGSQKWTRKSPSLRAAQAELSSDEKVLAVLPANLDSAGSDWLGMELTAFWTGALVLTDRRLVYAMESRVGQERAEVLVSAMDSVNWTRRLLEVLITISADGDEHAFTTYSTKDAPAFVARLNSMVKPTQSTTSTTSASSRWPDPPPPPTSGPPPGWYQNPNDPAQQRWWDGSTWTEHIQTATPPPPPPPKPTAEQENK